MTNPTHAVLRPPSAPVQQSGPEDVSPSSQVLGKDRKDEKMTLDADDRFMLCESWKKPQQYEKEGNRFNWDLHTFLSYLTPYFTGKSVKAKLELIKGVLGALGGNLIKAKLERKIEPELRGLIPPFMGDFCKLESGYELWVTLPSSFAEDREILQNYADFSIYCLAVQSLTNPPNIHPMIEFGAYVRKNNAECPIDEKVAMRQKEVKEAIEKVKKTADFKKGEGKAGISVEISDGAQTSIKITFAFEPVKSSDDLRLDIGVVQDVLFPILILPERCNGYDILQDQLKGGSAAFPVLSQAMGVLFPSLGNRSLSLEEQTAQLEQLFASLKGEAKYSEEALSLYAVLHSTGRRSVTESDVLDLPQWIGKASERGDLATIFEKLARIYHGSRFEHLMKAVEKRVLSVENHQAERAVLEALLLSGESKIFSAVWNLYQKDCEDSHTEIELSLLLEIAPTLDMSTFPVVVNYVCTKEVKSSSERFRLLVAYFNQLAAAGLEPLYPVYSSALLVPIDGLLETDPTSLELYPRLRRALSDRISMRMGQLKESLDLLKSQSDVWWNKFIQIQQEIETPEHQEKFDQLFQAAIRIREGRLSNKAGFVNIFIRITDDLFSRKAYAPLIRLLEPILIVEADTIVYPRFQRLLNSLMEGNTSVAIWAAALAAFRTSEAYKHKSASRAFILPMMRHLTEKFIDEGIWQEINFLRDHIKPKIEEMPGFPRDLLAYYFCQTDLNVLIGDMTKSLKLFADWKEKGVIDEILRCVTSAPKDKVLWEKLTKLVDRMKDEDFFVEGVIQVLEALSKAGVHELSAQCFKKPIPRLNRLQKVRLARVYGAAILQVREALKPEMIQGVPSREWLLGQLKTEETWQEHARLFLDLSLRHPIDLQEGLWIAPRVIASADQALVEEFSQFLVRTPHKNLTSSEWPYIIAGVIACNLSGPAVGVLFRHLLEKTGAFERAFVKHCAELQKKGSETECQNLLKQYHATKSVPSYAVEAIVIEPEVEQRHEISRRLFKKKISLENLKEILDHLTKLSSNERALWERFFNAFPTDAPTDFLKMAWKAWVEKHPLNEIQEEDEKSWVAAIDACLNRPKLTGEMSKEIENFLIRPALRVLIHLGSSCVSVAVRCFEMGIESSWDETPDQNKHKLMGLSTLFSSPLIKEKIGDLRLLLNSCHMIQLALLLTEQADDDPYEFGHDLFMALMMAIDLPGDYGSEANKVLFQYYCTRPYAPRKPDARSALYHWIEKSWAAQKFDLNWAQGCSLIKILCRFQEEGHLSCETLYSMWEKLASGTWLQRPKKLIREILGIAADVPMEAVTIVQPRPPAPFVKATLEMLDHLMKRAAEPHQRILQLSLIHRNFTAYINKHSMPGDECRSQFQLQWCSHALVTVPSEPTVEEYQVLETALTSLKKCVSFMRNRWDQSSALAIKRFAAALPSLINLTNPDWLNKLSALIKALAEVPAIVDESKRGEDDGLKTLLVKLCDSIEKAPIDLQNKRTEFVLKIFMDLISPTAIKKEIIQFQKQAITLSSEVFVSFFLPLELENLDLKLETAISSLPVSLIQESLAELARTIPKVAWLNLAAPRLIHWARPDSYVSLLELEESCLDLAGAYLLVNHETKRELQTLAEWVLAISALMNKYIEFSDLRDFTINLEFLKELKTNLTKKLVTQVLSMVYDEKSYESYTPFLTNIARTDLDINEALSHAFIIPEGLPISKKLLVLKNVLNPKK